MKMSQASNKNERFLRLCAAYCYSSAAYCYSSVAYCYSSVAYYDAVSVSKLEAAKKLQEPSEPSI